MIFTEQPLSGVFLIELDPYFDERGFFARSFCTEEFGKKNISHSIKQCNISYNKQKYTLRGLHLQKKPYEETKIVRVLKGSIYDVALDLRKASETFGSYVGVILSSDKKNALVIPEGCAHGFLTLEDDTDVMYMVTSSYHPESEIGIRYNDPAFSIKWPHDPLVISQKDLSHPLYS